jgi:hypothetical protein
MGTEDRPVCAGQLGSLVRRGCGSGVSGMDASDGDDVPSRVRKEPLRDSTSRLALLFIRSQSRGFPRREF